MAAAAASVLTSGCTGDDSDDDPNSPIDTAAAKSSVPLRLCVIGPDIDGDQVKRAFESIADATLDVTVLGTDRSPPPTLRWQTAVANADVIIAPRMMSADLVAAGAVEKPRGSWVESPESEFLPSLRASMVVFGNDAMMFAVGAKRPAVFIVNDRSDSRGESRDDSRGDQSIRSWQTMARHVESLELPRWAVPIADGFIAETFLLARGGLPLFDATTFEPNLTDDASVAALDTLRRFARLAIAMDRPRSRCTPEAIVDAVIAGDLDGGVGIPSTSNGSASSDLGLGDSASGDLASVELLPLMPDERLVVDSMAPTAMISSRCRQSALAKSLVSFLSEGASDDANLRGVRRRIGGVTPVRRSMTPPANDYDQYLADVYETPLVASTFRILDGWEYYHALDTTLAEGLDDPDDATSMDLLTKAKGRFNDLTQRIGVQEQLRTLRRSQGMRG